MVDLEAEDIQTDEHLDLHETENHMHDLQDLLELEIDRTRDQIQIDDLPRNLNLILLVDPHIRTDQEILVLNLEEEMILDLVEIDLETDLDPILQIGDHPDNNYHFKYKKKHIRLIIAICVFLFRLFF